MSDRASFSEKAQNLAKFSWDLVKHLHKTQGQNLTVSDEVYAERVTICKGCPEYLELQNECRNCGCYIPMKAKIILDSCPLGKWTEDKEGWEKSFERIVEELDNETKSE